MRDDVAQGRSRFAVELIGLFGAENEMRLTCRADASSILERDSRLGRHAAGLAPRGVGMGLTVRLAVDGIALLQADFAHGALREGQIEARLGAVPSALVDQMVSLNRLAARTAKGQRFAVTRSRAKGIVPNLEILALDDVATHGTAPGRPSRHGRRDDQAENEGMQQEASRGARATLYRLSI